MKILGIDTTTKSAGCTVLNNDKYYTKEVTNEITHSEKLLPIIHETLNESQTNLNDIDMYAAINGPGSFTGIRIGLATIKAFAQVTEKDIFSISSIDLISYCAFKAQTGLKETYVLSLIDARNDRVYYGINKLKKDDNGKVTIEKIIDVGNDTIDEVIQKISEENIIVAGNCVNKFKEKLKDKCYTLLDIYPTTEDLISCYLDIEDTTPYMYNAYSLDALYARESQAERMSKNG